VDIFERREREVEIDGCPGVTVTIREMRNSDLRLLQDANGNVNAALEALRGIVVAIGGLKAGGAPLDTLDKLIEAADADDAAIGPVSQILKGITEQAMLASAMTGGDPKNSLPLSDSEEEGSGGTAKNAKG